MDKEDLKYIEQGLLVCGVEGELNEELNKATPYMLRNDGKCFECEGWHPYISNIYDDENDLDSLINERLWELKWYYDNSLVSDVKKYIEILVKSCCEKDMNFKKDKQELFNIFNVKEDTYTCRDDNELYSMLNNINNLTNQEFCKVRTSNIKIGGDSNDIYFRISSIGFNWFNIIWKFVMDNAKDISSVTISRDTRVRDFTQGECYRVNGVEINHLPTDEFLTLKGRPTIEAFKSKLNVINEALPKLASGKSLSDAYPNLHPKDVNGFYKKQIGEELAWDIENILQPINKNILNEKFANNIDKDILNIIKNPKSETNFSKCSKSAAIRLVIAYNNPKYKDIKLCLGYFSPKGDEGVNNINHAWVEIDGKTYESNVPSGDYKKVLVDELTIDRNEDLYNQVEEFLNKTNLQEDLSQEVDSEGNPLTPEQVEFFKNSKVRDSQGRLLVVYHGTDADFNEFKKEFMGTNPRFALQNGGYGGANKGFFFTNDEWYASNVGKNVKKCYLNITNPLNIKGSGWGSAVSQLDRRRGDIYRWSEDNHSDGIIVTSTDFELYNHNDLNDDKVLGLDTIFVAFNPNQIKAITNKQPSSSSNINEEILYHGQWDDDLINFEDRLTWFTPHREYAQEYGGKIFNKDIDISKYNLLYVGEINQEIKEDDEYTDEFIEFCDAIEMTPEQLSDYLKRFGFNLDYETYICEITAEYPFYRLLKDLGYDGVEAEEGGYTTYGLIDFNKDNEQITEALTTDNYYRYEILEDGKLVGGLFKGAGELLGLLKLPTETYGKIFHVIGKELPKPDINYEGSDSELVRSAFTEKGVEKFDTILKEIRDELKQNNITLVKKKVNPDEDAIIYGDDYQIVYYDDMANVEPLEETQKLYNIKEYYHGSPSKELSDEINSTLWFTDDIIYAMRYGENIFTCDLSVNNPLNVGDTNKYIRGLMPNTFSQEFIDIAKALNVEPKKLLHIDEDARKIYTIVRTKEFKDLCIKNGYDAIQTIEDGSICYGIFDLNQIKVNDIDLG